MLTGQDLIGDMVAYRPDHAQPAVWWLGQHSFVLKLGSATVYIDPYLSDDSHRLVPSLLRPQDVVNADLVLGSHDHDDHIDRRAWPVVATSSPQSVFVVPEMWRDNLAADLGIPSERFVGINDGQSVDINGLKITAVASAHEFLDRDEGTGLYPCLGYVIEGDGCTIYHSGDTCRYEGLATRLSQWSFDLMILPINGRDAVRLASGCIGNMTYQEAADLAGALRSRVVIPAHYDMFEGNTEDPRLFSDYMGVKYPDLKVCVCEYGKRLLL